LTNLSPAPESIQIIGIRNGTRREDRNYKPGRISFDIVSEDLGDDLEALVFLNFKGVNVPPMSRPLCPIEKIAPGTLTQAEPRPVVCDFQLTAATEPACHSVTAVVSHQFVSILPAPATPGDIATATWFFQVGVDESAPDREYEPCIPNPTPTDGGADAATEGGAL
jgi:hypothetical protein